MDIDKTKTMSIKEKAAFIAKIRSNKDKAALIWLLNTPQGRWFIMRIIDKYPAFEQGKCCVAMNILDDIKKLGIERLLQKQLAERELMQWNLDVEKIYAGGD